MPSSRSALWLLAAFLILAALAWAASARGAMYALWVQDVFVPLEGVIHIQQGGLPHRDFATPVGGLYYFIEYLPTLIAPLSARTLIQANMIVAFALFGLVAWRVRGRLPDWAVALASLYVALVALSTRQIGEKIAFVTNNAAYNRWSWAILAALALVVALPRLVTPELIRGPAGSSDTRQGSGTPGRARGDGTVDGAIAGTLLAALFLIKITYFAAGIGLVLVALATVRRVQALRFGGAAAILLLAILAITQLSTGMIGAYLADMRMAVAVQPSKLRIETAQVMAIAFAPGAIVIAMLALMARREGTRWSALSPALMALATVGAGWAVAIQNHPEFENPMLPVAALIAWFAIGSTAPRPSSGLLARLVIIGVFLIPIGQDAGALAWSATAPIVTRPELAWLNGTPMRDLKLMDAPWPLQEKPPAEEFANDVELIGALGDGATLVRSHIGARRDVTLFPLTWSNPWPALIGTRPVRGELAWWHDGRTFSGTLHPDPKLLDTVDYVLVPHRYNNWPTTQTMLEAYGPKLIESFRPAGQSKGWTLYARRDCARRGLC